MDNLLINADRNQPALVHGGSLPWVPSPQAGVERRMLERSGGEVAMASTIVRYQAGSRFPAHTHALGEEFLVLSGIFSDELGNYAEGSYVRNPPGSAHAPFSEHGCVIFVKLRQMNADEPESIRVLPHQRVWQAGETHGHEYAAVYDNGRIRVTLERLSAGVALPERSADRGEEILVVAGSITFGGDERRSLDTWGWSRRPGAIHDRLDTDSGALLWIKRGHLE